MSTDHPARLYYLFEATIMQALHQFANYMVQLN